MLSKRNRSALHQWTLAQLLFFCLYGTLILLQLYLSRAVCEEVLPCPACILCSAGRKHCFWAEGLIFAACLDMAEHHIPTPALSLWLCLCGNRESAAWEEPAFVRMSGVPWFRSYCHLLLFRRGEGRMEGLHTAPHQPLFTPLFCVLFDF